MASNETLIDDQSIINPNCELCDYEREARWICKNCQHRMCLQCKTTHQAKKAGSSHKIKEIKAKDSPLLRQKTKMHCSTHHKETAIKFCKDCNVAVCSKCMEHINHNTDTIQNTFQNYRNEISNYVEKAKLHVSSLQAFLHTVQENERSYCTEILNIVNHINRRRQEWKSQIDQMADKTIQKLQKLETQNLQDLRKQDANISKQISLIGEMLQICAEKLQSSHNDESVINLLDLIKTGKADFPHCPKHLHVSPPKFISSDIVKLPVDFGQLENDEKLTNVFVSPPIDTTTVANINIKNSTCISAVDETKAWYGHGFGSGGSSVTLVGIEGTIIKKVNLDFELYGITVTNDGILMATKWHGHHVKKSMDGGNFVNIIDTTPFKTRGMCATSDNDLLVCLSRDTMKQTRVLRITTSGKIKQIIQQTTQHKNLFNAPRLVAENINSDICVVDGYSSLVVVSKDGNPRFTYPESSIEGTAISRCDGIVCGKFGYIFISDCYNHHIHQVDKDGEFVQYILTEDNGIEYPWGLSCDNKGQLWICNNNGNEMMVLKFRS